MINIRTIELEDILGNIETHIIIDNGDGSYTSMLKSNYDQLQLVKANELEIK